MTRLAAVVLIIALTCGCYCRARIVQPTGPPAVHDIVGLLQDPATKGVGSVVVSSRAGGSAVLMAKETATRVVIGQPPSVVFKFSDDQIDQLFGDALVAMPPVPRHFLLYFAAGSNQLTPASERALPEILAFVNNRSVPDVHVVGHTDTTGDAQDNIERGRNRATMIRDRLVAAGLDGSIVSVASHGEADLLVRTPDNTSEPKNHRVDVSVH